MGLIVLIWGCVFSFILVFVLTGYLGIMGFLLGIVIVIGIMCSIVAYQCQCGPTDLRDDWPHAKKRTQRLAEFIASRVDIERGEHC